MEKYGHRWPHSQRGSKQLGYTEREGTQSWGQRRKKEADRSRLVGSRFNEQGHFPMRLVLGGPKASGSPCLLSRVLKVYAGDLAGFSHMYCPDSLNTHCSLKAVSLKTTLSVGTVDRTYIPRTGGMSGFRMSGSSSRVHWTSQPLDDLRSQFGHGNNLG